MNVYKFIKILNKNIGINTKGVDENIRLPQGTILVTGRGTKTITMENVIKNGINRVAENREHREGGLARPIEEQTAKLPSDVFLWASVTAMAASLTLQIMGRKHKALFVGQWAALFFCSVFIIR